MAGRILMYKIDAIPMTTGHRYRRYKSKMAAQPGKKPIVTS